MDSIKKTRSSMYFKIHAIRIQIDNIKLTNEMKIQAPVSMVKSKLAFKCSIRSKAYVFVLLLFVGKFLGTSIVIGSSLWFMYFCKSISSTVGKQAECGLQGVRRMIFQHVYGQRWYENFCRSDREYGTIRYWWGRERVNFRREIGSVNQHC